MDPQKDTIGKWRRDGDTLVKENSPGSSSRVSVPYFPADEYDVLLEFTLDSGKQDIKLHGLPKHGRFFEWCQAIEGSTILHPVAGKDWRNTPARAPHYKPLEQKRHYTGVLQVRRERVVGKLEGDATVQWHAGMGTLGGEGEAEKGFYLYGDSAGFSVYRFAVREVTGRGTFTRPDDPAAKAAMAKRDGQAAPAVAAQPETPPAAYAPNATLAKMMWTDFTGGKDYDNFNNQGKKSRAVWAIPSGQNTLSATFELAPGGYGAGQLLVTSLLHSRTPCLLTIALNGQQVFDGRDKAATTDRGKWSEQRYPFGEGVLRAGRNEVRISNMESKGSRDAEPWYMVHCAEVMAAAQPEIADHKPEASVAVPPRSQALADRARPGLLATYYASGNIAAVLRDAAPPALGTRVVENINIPDKDKLNAMFARSENIGVAFSGSIEIPADGDYTFWTSSDDGSLLSIGDSLIVDNDGPHGTGEKNGRISLKAGWQRFRLYYGQGTGSAAVIAGWSGPNVPKQIIPPGAFCHVPEANMPAMPVLNLETHLLFELKGHAEAVTSVALSPDGRFVATASGDRTIRLWSTATGHEVQMLSGHSSGVEGIAFSPNGRGLVSVSWDRTVRLWDLAAGQTVRTIRQPAGSSSVAFSPDSRWVLTASDDKQARLWDAGTGQEAKPFASHTGGVVCAAFSPDGKRIATASRDKTVKIWEVATGRVLATCTGHGEEAWCVAFSPDGTKVASASKDKTARLWDAATSRELVMLKGHGGEVRWVAFSPDGAWLATASFDKTARMWDAATGRQVGELPGHGDQLRCVAISSDGSRVVTASKDKTARIWEVKPKTP